MTTPTLERDTEALLDQPLYSYGLVDRMLGLNPGTAKRWLEGYARGGRNYEPVLRVGPTDSPHVTWGEFVETRLLAEYRAAGVPLVRLRPAVEVLRDHLGPYPLAKASTWLTAENRELVWTAQHGVEPQLWFVVRSGQLLLTSKQVETFRSVTEFDGDVASAIHLAGPASAVLADPARSFGKPSIHGIRIEVIAEEVAAGTPAVEVANMWPSLSVDDVEQAVRFAAA